MGGIIEGKLKKWWSDLTSREEGDDGPSRSLSPSPFVHVFGVGGLESDDDTFGLDMRDVQYLFRALIKSTDGFPKPAMVWGKLFDQFCLLYTALSRESREAFHDWLEDQSIYLDLFRVNDVEDLRERYRQLDLEMRRIEQALEHDDIDTYNSRL